MKPHTCPVCEGSGGYKKDVSVDVHLGHRVQYQRPCHACGGKGVVWEPDHFDRWCSQCTLHKGCCPDVAHGSLREKLAQYAHDSWSRYIHHLLSKCSVDWHGNHWIPPEYAEQLTREMETPYEFLSEKEKDSDRMEAHRMLAVCAQAPYQEEKP